MRRWALGLLCWTLAAAAQIAGAPEIKGVALDFQYGKFAEVLERIEQRIDRGGLTDAELVELHKYAGLSAFNLGRLGDANRHLTALLRIEPDYSLDPFVYPPPAIQLLEKKRKEMTDELDAIRRERRLEAERKQRIEAEREQLRREAEEQRRRIEELSRKVTVRTIEKRSFLVNFVPFGAGQFQQNRLTLGVALAASEGVLAATSIIAYLVEASFSTCSPFELLFKLTPTGSQVLQECGIPQQLASVNQLWRGVKYISGGAFYAVYAYGVVDAVYHHEDQTEAVQVIDQGAPAPVLNLPDEHGALDRPPARSPISARFSLAPIAGGLSGALTIRF